MIRGLLNWLDHRVGYREILHEALFERVPGGARWRYVWGSTLVFTFVVQLITGIFLWMSYSPSAQTAWESVYYIEHEMTLGSVVRGLHHFTAQAMVVLMVIHLLQVILDGAYRAPREVNFWLGLILMQIVLGLSLTGYLLPWDQKGYYATQVATKIMGSTPGVGNELQQLVQGGTEYGHHTLTRFFALHAGLLPGALIAFLALHIYVFRRHGLTVKDPDHAPDTTFWPDQVLKDGIACLAVLLLVLLLALWIKAPLAAPANPSESYAAARPEWYFLFMFRFLKFEFIEHYGVAFGAIYLPGLIMGLVVLMPLIGRHVIGHKVNVAFTWILMLGVGLLTLVALVEDKYDTSHQAAILEADRDAQRIKELAAGPRKIPVAGAVTLLRQDPFTQGPRLFAKHCAACHRYDGHNGRGRMVEETGKDGKLVTARPTAADLGNFGSRDWMRSVILDYSSHFAPLKNAPWFKPGDENILNPDTSDMADWSLVAESLRSSENTANVEAVVEFLVSLAAHNRVKLEDGKADLGRKLVHDTEAGWAGGEFSQTCADCHGSIAKTFTRRAENENDAPDLSGYASAAWLRDFISNAGSPQHYGEKNKMPVYSRRMTPGELEQLVRWLVQDYEKTEVPRYKDRRTKKTAPQGES